jgi:Flp pilus assembly protein TadB
MTAGILTTMPILLMLALLFVAPGYLQGLWADEDGKKLVGAALAAQFLGRFTISRIVRVRV